MSNAAVPSPLPSSGRGFPSGSMDAKAASAGAKVAGTMPASMTGRRRRGGGAGGELRIDVHVARAPRPAWNWRRRWRWPARPGYCRKRRGHASRGLRCRAVRQCQGIRAVPNDAVDQRGPSAAWRKAVGRAPAGIVIEEPDAARAIDDGVVHEQGVALVLHGNAGRGAVEDEIVHHDGRAFVAQHDAMIVAAADDVPDDDRRASCRVDHVVVSGIEEDIVADERRRRALAVHVDVVIVAVMVR